MSVAIRLSRGGSKKRPYYKVVVSNSRAPRDGKYLEQLGTYNPLLAKDDEKRFIIDVEKAKAWIAKGAQPTDRVARNLAKAGVGKWENSNNPKAAEPGEKAKERAKERAEREEARRAAAAAPAEEAAAE